MSWRPALLAVLTIGAPTFRALEAATVHPLEGPPDDNPSLVAFRGNVSSLAWDGDSIWVGYFDAGLARVRDGHWSEVAIDGSPQNRWINSLCWDGETLWAGSTGGLFRWNGGSRSMERLEEFEGSVQSVRNDSGILVVAGSDRVWIARGSDWERIELPGEAIHTAFVHRGTLWVGGMWGVLERREEGWRRYSELNGRLPHSWVTSLLTLGDTVWAGTYDAGLVALTDEGPARPVRGAAWVNFNALQHMSGGVAVGTMGDGLLLWNEVTRSWRRLSMSDGLLSDDVTAVLETPEALWVGTRGGLVELPAGVGLGRQPGRADVSRPRTQ